MLVVKQCAILFYAATRGGSAGGRGALCNLSWQEPAPDIWAPQQTHDATAKFGRDCIVEDWIDGGIHINQQFAKIKEAVKGLHAQSGDFFLGCDDHPDRKYPGMKYSDKWDIFPNNKNIYLYVWMEWVKIDKSDLVLKFIPNHNI